jgi:hypothetical protein
MPASAGRKRHPYRTNGESRQALVSCAGNLAEGTGRSSFQIHCLYASAIGPASAMNAVRLGWITRSRRRGGFVH